VFKISRRSLAIGLASVSAIGLSTLVFTDPAWAACSTATGISFYDNANCTTFLKTINGDTQINDLGATSPNMKDKISSVLESPATSQGSWRLYLHSSINLGGTYLGLSNASTTSFKYWNLSQLNFDNKAESLCQFRAVGSSSPC
jgi:hypothetical protein